MTGQTEFMRLRIGTKFKRGVFVDQLRHRRRQFHVVLAIAGFDGEGIDRRARRHARPRLQLLAVGAEQIAAPRPFQPAKADNGAGAGDILFGQRFALHIEHAGDALVGSIRRRERLAIVQLAPHHPHERLAACLARHSAP